MTDFLAVGDKVIYDGTGAEEKGIVVATWMDTELEIQDCYVAFFGKSWPNNVSKPKTIPYILRYAACSLRRVNETRVYWYVMRTHSGIPSRITTWKLMSRRILEKKDAQRHLEFCKSEEKNKRHGFFLIQMEDKI